MIAGAGAAGAALLLLLVLLSRGVASSGVENGLFANDCCGTLELSDGGMRLNDKQTVRYSVGRDAAGPYVLPGTYVGAVEDRGLEVDGTRPTRKLRLDRLPAPNSILLYDGTRPFLFKRQAAGSRARP
jgi:hypothetical protein